MRLPTLALAFALLFLLASARAGVQVRLDVRTQVESVAGMKGETSDTRSAIELTLGDRFFIVRADGRSVVHDLQRRTRTVIDDASRTRRDYSLFDTLGPRSRELTDRVGRARFLEGAGLGQGEATTVDHEHALAVQQQPSAPLEAARDGADQTFSHGRRVLMRRSIEGTTVSAQDSLMWAQFVRYGYGGHPQLLADMGRAGTIPVSTVLVLHQDKTTTRHSLVVRSVRAIDAVPVEMSAVARRPISASDDPVDQALDRASTLADEDIAQRRRRSQEQFAADMRDDRQLRAFLRLLEWSATTGETLVELTPAHRASLQASESVKVLGAALASETSADRRKAVGSLPALRQEAGDLAPVLAMMEGSLRRQLGDRRAARDLFLQALEAAPRMAGVYKDLGDILLAEGDAARAWRSWHIGRRLAPQSPVFRAVTELEQKLAQQHPEYF